MPTLLEQVAGAAQKRDEWDYRLKLALVAAKEVHSWAEIAKAAGMSRGGVIHLYNGALARASDQKGEK